MEKRGDKWDLHCRIHLFIGDLSVERVRSLHPLHFSALQSERFTAAIEVWIF